VTSNEQEAVWEVAQAMAEEDSTYYNDNDGRMHCPFCIAQTSSFIHEFPHTPDCIVVKARALMAQRNNQSRKEIIDATCDVCGKRYHGLIEDVRGWYGFIEVEPQRKDHTFCSEAHLEQWKAERGIKS
jgi:hypothetical protein